MALKAFGGVGECKHLRSWVVHLASDSLCCNFIVSIMEQLGSPESVSLCENVYSSSIKLFSHSVVAHHKILEHICTWY